VRTYAVPLVPLALEDHFFRVVRGAFQQRRKQLHNSLRANLALDAAQVDNALRVAGVEPEARPQTLDVAAWLRLTEALYPADLG
jgi:16S rRNA (adenine1518-N6/adenine1519-N6)-dimethyltransferase